MTTVLKSGGEVHFNDDDADVRVYDRIEIIDGGLIRCINKKGYQQDIYPPSEVSGLHSHTKELEGAEWW